MRSALPPLRALRQQRSCPPSCRARAGVTLIELMVVLGILSIVGGLAFPWLAGFTHPEVTAHDVVAKSRQTAIARAQSLQLQFLGSGKWWLTTPGDEAVILSGELRSGAMDAVVRIGPLGSCSVTAAGTAGEIDAISCSLPAPRGEIP
ncbi:MAG: pilus assembly FimT family protein [Gemmatimonadota bacterium]